MAHGVQRVGRNALACVLLLGVLAAANWYYLNHPLPTGGEEFTFLVPTGGSLAEVVMGLSERGIIRYPALFTLHAHLRKLHLQLLAGRYRLPPDTTASQLLAALGELPNVLEQATLVEGWTLARARAELREHAIGQTLAGLDEATWLEHIGATGFPAAEGLFFPDTYSYATGAGEDIVLRQAHQRMMTVLNEEWEARAPNLPYQSSYETLIAASIIERETGLAEERSTIAGVITRRLQRKMRLEMDPTVIYGLGKKFTGKLRRSQLADASNPYNTYRHAGLPPTPICLPGRAAIHATLHPDDSDALYFVARGDGSHQFSATLAQHRAAVRIYRDGAGAAQ